MQKSYQPDSLKLSFMKQALKLMQPDSLQYLYIQVYILNFYHTQLNKDEQIELI